MEEKKSTTGALNRTNTHTHAKNCLLPSEIATFKKSLLNQINSLSSFELINLIQISQVAVNLESILEHTFSESDVYIIFSNFGPSLDFLINEWCLDWIIGFKYFHCHVFQTSDEENPTKNPRWNEITSLDRTNLLSLLDDFMFPMFTDTLEICFMELLDELGR
jgi:hypothetical protein